MAVLKPVTGDLAGKLIELKSDVTVIGRSPECDIILTTNGVSRRHAEIRKRGDTFFLADLKSLNKTLVNNVAVASGSDHSLKENDRINICGVEFIYYPVALPKAKEPEPAGDLMSITEGDGMDDPGMLTLDASRTERDGQRRLPRGKAQGGPGDHPKPLQRVEDRHCRPQGP